MTTASVNMPAVENPVELESQISDLLADLSAVQAELLDVLQQKRDRLAAVDLPGLAALQPKEEELLRRLENCQERRRELLAAAAVQGRTESSIHKLAIAAKGAWRGKLGEQVKDSSARTRLLQHHSLANWVLAQRCLLHVSQLLEIVATGGRMQPTYGDKESVHARGTLVNHEA